ncbi:hypothetical protein TRFO_33002 [Tritrichomonas foetus]|uniref:Uncharacterized protein n=1 Tax=Tritrichomonas foetus TaxID=1144522 RepID=A0A1J4JS55_9EUKA|nr:hypothetical protein TRFO_33002 [Tritrichomonas foetus]|eukprot:OHT00356.1 hypothetical protein TRFO_33002 [Tritrichomonas foetus]
MQSCNKVENTGDNHGSAIEENSNIHQLSSCNRNKSVIFQKSPTSNVIKLEQNDSYQESNVKAITFPYSNESSNESCSLERDYSSEDEKENEICKPHDADLVGQIFQKFNPFLFDRKNLFEIQGLEFEQEIQRDPEVNNVYFDF